MHTGHYFYGNTFEQLVSGVEDAELIFVYDSRPSRLANAGRYVSIGSHMSAHLLGTGIDCFCSEIPS